MKRIAIFITIVSIIILSCVTAKAEETTNPASEPGAYDTAEALKDSLKLDEMYSKLPSEARKSLNRLGISGVDADCLSSITLGSIIESITETVENQSGEVFVHLPVIISILLIFSVVDNLKASLTSATMSEVLSVVTALCIACALVIPIGKVIEDINDVIAVASNFMLAYIPIMVSVLISCGKALSGSGYYTLMIAAAQGIAQISAKFITPMLNVFLGLSICSSTVPNIKLDAVVATLGKTIKWLLSFSFTIFSALLTFRTLISTSMDSVSTRAVRYTMSSFIPVVGAALSEAYKTVQGSINVLKNGIGVFVIFAIAVVFMPIIIKLILWIFAVSISKTVAQMLGLNQPLGMLSGISTVLSVLFAVIICIMALFIISTALIITAGGYGI